MLMSAAKKTAHTHETVKDQVKYKKEKCKIQNKTVDN